MQTVILLENLDEYTNSSVILKNSSYSNLGSPLIVILQSNIKILQRVGFE